MKHYSVSSRPKGAREQNQRIDQLETPFSDAADAAALLAKADSDLFHFSGFWRQLYLESAL